MELRDYLEANKKILIDIKKIPSIVLGSKEEYPKDDKRRIFIEINLDDIEDFFPIPYNVGSFDLKDFSNQIFYNKDTILSVYPSFDFHGYMKLMFKDGKFYPCPKPCLSDSLEIIYLMVAYLKQLKKEQPEIKMPTLTCIAYDFELSEENKIYQEYIELLKHRRDIVEPRGNIFVDINKKVSSMLSIRYVNKDGIKIKKVVEKCDRKQIEKEIQDLKKAEEISFYKKSSYLKVEFDDNNEIIYFNGKEQVSIDSLYSECLYEARKQYIENVKMMNKLYNDNKSIVERYSSIINRIYSINRKIDYYDSLIESIGGRISLIKNKVSSTENNPVISLFSEDISMIEDSIKTFNGLPIEHLDKLYKIVKYNNDISKKIEFMENYFRNINNNIAHAEEYLKGIEENERQIEGQSIFKLLKSPIKLERKPLVSILSINENKTEKEPKTKKEEIDSFLNLQKKQSDLLSEQDKENMMVYKTLLYRPINHIINLKRKQGFISDKDIDIIIRDSYNELLSREKDPSMQMPERGNYHPNIGVLDENNNIVSYEQFKKIVLDSIPSLEKSLKLVTIDEPLTVYRGLSTEDINKKEKGFLSTTIDQEVALSFLDSNKRKEKGKSVIYKINLPKGSPVNFYSTEIFIGSLDEKHSSGAFGDGQKEVLIDADNFNFEIVSVRTINDVDINRKNRLVYFVEINAIPIIKTDEYHQDIKVM